MKNFIFKLLLSFCSLFVLTACAGKFHVDGKLTSVQRSDYKDRFDTYDHSFKDDTIGFLGSLSSNEMLVDITNMTPRKMLVRWDESVFVDLQGASHRVHFANVAETSLSAVPSSQPASVLVSGSSVVGYVRNVDNYLYVQDSYSPGYITKGYNNTSYYTPGTIYKGYYYHAGLLARIMNKNLTPEEVVAYGLNKPVKLVLALEIDGYKMDYIFTFVITKYGNDVTR